MLIINKCSVISEKKCINLETLVSDFFVFYRYAKQSSYIIYVHLNETDIQLWERKKEVNQLEN